MPTIGQQFASLNDFCLNLYAIAQKAVDPNDSVFENAYENIVIREDLDQLKKLEKNLKTGLLGDKERQDYERLKAYLAKPEVKTQKGRIEHLFKLAFAALGRDTIPLEISALSSSQKTHLVDQYYELKNDLLAITQRMVLMTLKHKNYSLPVKTAEMTDEFFGAMLLNYLENLKQDDEFARNVQAHLQEMWIKMAIKIDEQINLLMPPNLNQANLVVGQNPPSVVVVKVPEPQKINMVSSYHSSSLGGDIFDSFFATRSSHYHSCYRYHSYHYHNAHHNPWHRGWHDAHYHHHDMWLYHGHCHDPIGFEMMRCFEKICCDTVQFKGLCPCDSCGKLNCTSCPSILPCNACNNIQCVCDKLANCSLPELPSFKACGRCQDINCCGCVTESPLTMLCNACHSINCSCSENLCSNVCGQCRNIDCSCVSDVLSNICGMCKDIECSGCDKSADAIGACLTAAGGCIVGTVKLIFGCKSEATENEDLNPYGDFSRSSTGPHFSGNSVSHRFQAYSQHDLYSSTGVTAVAAAGSQAKHAVYLESTASQVAGTVAYMAFAAPRILHACIVPAKNIYQGYKVQDSQRKIVGSVLAGLSCFLTCYFPMWGGPNSAIVWGGVGILSGSAAAKRYNDFVTKTIFNGETNPEKWLLTSEVITAFKRYGVTPQELMQLIFTLREIKQQGAIKTNNQWYGAFRIFRFLGYLSFSCVDQFKHELEILPDDAMKLLREQRVEEAFSLMNHKLKMFTPAIKSPVSQVGTLPVPVFGQFSNVSAPVVPAQFTQSSVAMFSGSSIQGPTHQAMDPAIHMHDVALDVHEEEEYKIQPIKQAPTMPYYPSIGC